MGFSLPAEKRAEIFILRLFPGHGKEALFLHGFLQGHIAVPQNQSEVKLHAQ